MTMMTASVWQVAVLVLLSSALLAGCGGSNRPVPEVGAATIENAWAAWVPLGEDRNVNVVGGVGDQLVTIETETGRFLRYELAVSAAGQDEITGVKGLKLVFSEATTLDHREELVSRAAELNVGPVVFLGPNDLWPGCDEGDDRSTNCLTVAESLLPGGKP